MLYFFGVGQRAWSNYCLVIVGLTACSLPGPKSSGYYWRRSHSVYGAMIITPAWDCEVLGHTECQRARKLLAMATDRLDLSWGEAQSLGLPLVVLKDPSW